MCESMHGVNSSLGAHATTTSGEETHGDSVTAHNLHNKPRERSQLKPSSDAV